ncbi:MAG: hypothetical protein ABFQ53_04085 [Patescibacteria group bacterium]
MIDKIQGLIEDNTSMEITRSQVIMGLTVIALLFLFLVLLMTRSGSSLEDPKGTKVTQCSSDFQRGVL